MVAHPCWPSQHRWGRGKSSRFTWATEIIHTFKNLSKKGCRQELYHKCNLECTGDEGCQVRQRTKEGVTVCEDIKIIDMLRHAVLISKK